MIEAPWIGRPPQEREYEEARAVAFCTHCGAPIRSWNDIYEDDDGEVICWRCKEEIEMGEE